MAGTDTETKTGNERFSVLVGTDFGLEEWTVDAAAPNEDGIPTSLPEDVQYVYLTEEQSVQYWRGEFVVQRLEKAGHLGAFAIMFDEAPDRPEVTLPSLDRQRHSELIAITANYLADE